MSNTIAKDVAILQIFSVIVMAILVGILLYLALRAIGISEQAALSECVENGYTVEYCRSLLY